MTLAHLIAFNLTLLAAWASPGPAMLVALRTTLASGRMAGIVTGAGLATMAAIWTGAALVGLAGLFALVPPAYVALKTAGAAYLIWIAWRTWKSARDPIGQTDRPHGRAFLSGLLVNAANPKSVLFAGAVLIVIFPPDMTAAQKGLIVLNHLLFELLAYTILALALATEAVSRRYLAAKHILDRVAAGVLGALGLRLLIEK